MTDIYRYVVRYDSGTAPRPFGAVCSLAICKPMIRRRAKPGDWVVGFRSRRPGEVLYAMQVTETMPLGDYWEDARFDDRKPGRSRIPDNFYRRSRANELVQVRNAVHPPAEAAKDIRGRNVLLGERFWYFGDRSVLLPNHLLHLVHTTQGHSVHCNRRARDVEALEAWLDTWTPGIHGAPVDASAGIDEETRTAKSCGTCDTPPKHPACA